MTKQEVLDSIKDITPVFPKEALKEIQANRKEFIPELLDSLDYAYQNAKKLHEENSDYFLYTYAMFLLAEFREKRAFPKLISLLLLPDDEINFILGDRIAEDFGRLLLSTYDHKNMQMLLDVIENCELDEWARNSALSAYELLYKECFVSQEDFTSYLRDLIYDKLPPDDSSVVFTCIVGIVIDSHLINMIPDIRYLYDNDRVDTFVYGEYDGFIDSFFYEKQPKPSYIDDTISEMQWWACFEKENPDEDPKQQDKIFLDYINQMAKESQLEELAVPKKKKTGPNEPCPCGSGKKYKKCCSGTYQNSALTTRLEDKFDLLDMYPKNSALFNDLFEKEAVEIDMLVYKALSHRAIPIWVKRDWEQERIGKINYLNDALQLFLNKCQREQITSFTAYDDRFMVHYPSHEWVSALVDLSDACDSFEITSIRHNAAETLQNFS